MLFRSQVQAEKLIEDAKKQAESILAEAKKTADELNENTKSELKLFAGQAVNALKTEVANLLTNQTVEETVKGFTADKEFLYKFILALAEKWSANEPIEISVKDADSLKKYFTAKDKKRDFFADCRNDAELSVLGGSRYYELAVQQRCGCGFYPMGHGLF